MVVFTCSPCSSRVKCIHALLHGRVHVHSSGILKHPFHDCRRRCFGPGGIVHLLPQPLPLTNTPHTASSSSPQIRTATTAGAASKSNARGAAGSGGGGGTAEAGSIRVVLQVLWTLVSDLSLAAECLQLIDGMYPGMHACAACAWYVCRHGCVCCLRIEACIRVSHAC